MPLSIGSHSERTARIFILDFFDTWPHGGGLLVACKHCQRITPAIVVSAEATARITASADNKAALDRGGPFSCF
jgi:hypothetical protein